MGDFCDGLASTTCRPTPPLRRTTCASKRPGLPQTCESGWRSLAAISRDLRARRSSVRADPPAGGPLRRSPPSCHWRARGSPPSGWGQAQASGPGPPCSRLRWGNASAFVWIRRRWANIRAALLGRHWPGRRRHRSPVRATRGCVSEGCHDRARHKPQRLAVAGQLEIAAPGVRPSPRALPRLPSRSCRCSRASRAPGRPSAARA